MLFMLAFTAVGMHGVADAELPSNRKTTLSATEKKVAHVPASPTAPPRTHWALVVAGSRRYWNYRHQADVCHAYQLLKSRGFDDDHVITMVYDDIARSFWQLSDFYGKLFNRPGGPDVYKGCAKDYTRYDVTAKNFYNILAGNKEEMKNIGSGRVIESTANDEIFLFYSDHGSPGLIGMPRGGYVWADDFNKVVKKMHEDKKFHEMVIYMESCEAGSMFEGLLDKGLGVYALAAANATESSWATYCSDRGIGHDVSPVPSDIGTCMGDLFSTKWMEDTEASNPAKETLHSQFLTVAKATGKIANHGYGSEVVQYGDIKMDEEPVSEFMVVENADEPQAAPAAEAPSSEDFLARFRANLGSELDDPLVQHSNYLPGTERHVDQRDADMVFFMQRATTTNDMKEQDLMLNELRRAVLMRRRVDTHIRTIVGGLLEMRAARDDPISNGFGGAAAVERMVTHHMDRPGSGKPVVDDFDCLRGMMNHWEEKCGRVTDYSMKYSRTFANLCNDGFSVDEFAASAADVCTGRSEVDREADAFLEAQQSHPTAQRITVS